MDRKEADIKADIKQPVDRGENVSAFEPLLIAQNSPDRKKLTDLALKLATKSASFRRSLPLAIQTSLADMVRGMNCYYSNLIEGHDTHPIEIEEALHGNYSSDSKKRDLQLEAKAHITVQQWIDQGGLTGKVFSSASICEIHKRFCDLLPEQLLWVENSTQNIKKRLTPGQLRQQDVIVGSHVAISPGAIPRFLARYEQAYSNLGIAETVLALAAAHHRLLWIHPFLDGNGRVARLMSHAVTLEILDNVGLWSIARGLARHVNDYKSHLANCDLARRNDLDGRGNLSEQSLIAFSYFFLETCLDQINFMEKVMQPDRLKTRILLWAKQEIELGSLPKQALQILEAVLSYGEVPRGQTAAILHVTVRHARRIIATLIDKGVLVSATQRSPIKLAFSARNASDWLPGIFPPAAST